VEHRKRSVGAQPWETKRNILFSDLPKASAQLPLLERSASKNAFDSFRKV
jgi:hypothetical protein